LQKAYDENPEGMHHDPLHISCSLYRTNPPNAS
jgi:hypothetical protein